MLSAAPAAIEATGVGIRASAPAIPAASAAPAARKADTTAPLPTVAARNSGSKAPAANAVVVWLNLFHPRVLLSWRRYSARCCAHPIRRVHSASLPAPSTKSRRSSFSHTPGVSFRIASRCSLLIVQPGVSGSRWNTSTIRPVTFQIRPSVKVSHFDGRCVVSAICAAPSCSMRSNTPSLPVRPIAASCSALLVAASCPAFCWNSGRMRSAIASFSRRLPPVLAEALRGVEAVLPRIVST